MKVYSVNYDGRRMVYWEKNEDSAQYIIYLYLNAKCYQDRNNMGYLSLVAPEFLKANRSELKENEVVNQVINVINVPREKSYHTFDDLVHISSIRGYQTSKSTGLFYSVKIIAEDRNGNKIDESDEIQI